LRKITLIEIEGIGTPNRWIEQNQGNEGQPDPKSFGPSFPPFPFVQKSERFEIFPFSVAPTFAEPMAGRQGPALRDGVIEGETRLDAQREARRVVRAVRVRPRRKGNHSRIIARVFWLGGQERDSGATRLDRQRGA
jgi:hypothetical protein